MFVTHPRYDALKLFEELKEAGIYVRHWNDPKIKDYLRITIGTDEEMKIFIIPKLTSAAFPFVSPSKAISITIPKKIKNAAIFPVETE